MGVYLVFVVLSSYLFLTQVAEGSITDFDCVDIYKQPAFQHPLLKHHKVQKKFSSYGSSDNINTKYMTNYNSCPKGTVPILKQENETANVHIDTTEFFGQHFATVDTIFTGEIIYRGAQADISIHNLKVQNNQYSKSQFWLENRDRNQLNSIQVGWAVHPRLYGDSVTRLTIYWTADNYKRTGCYNMKCPGFVQVSRVWVPGVRFTKSSIYGGKEIFFFTPQVFQDRLSGHWVLKAFDEIIGYWPKELFTLLNKGANLVRFGGNTFVSPDGISPPMGNGHFPVEDFHKSSHHTQVKVINFNYELVDPGDRMTRSSSDAYQCFRILFWGRKQSLGVSLSFGGPGGNCGT